MAGWTSGSEEGCGMGIIEGVIGPLGKLIDRVIPDPEARDRAKLELIRLEGSQEMEALKTQLSAIVAEAQSSDAWTSRARPSFLYVMYALRSEEHTSELQSLMRISYAVFCLKKKKQRPKQHYDHIQRQHTTTNTP